eukprot:NODE_552_length_6155_cov_0.827774.p3 type:complete len:218 gc:universal NODE_552_length_6155_cov_0.827774:2446-3099(+)
MIIKGCQTSQLQMIFISSIFSIPQATSVGSFDNTKGIFTVKHEKVTCALSNGALSCGETDSDMSTWTAKTFNIAITPLSFDFRENSICVVDTSGKVSCGDQTDLFNLALISGDNVQEIRFSVFWPFMCVRANLSSVYCSQIDFSKTQVWTQMTGLTGIDKIRIEGGGICGHQTTEKNPLAFQCIPIGTKATMPKSGQTFAFDPAVGAAKSHPAQFKH